MKGFEFDFNPKACKDCAGYCCCGESGYVWVNQQEIADISAYLNISIPDFRENYTYREDNRISLKEIFTGEEYECVFFDRQSRKCKIYPVRPHQCRTYPFWGRFRKHMDEVMEECPGVFIPTSPIRKSRV